MTADAPLTADELAAIKARADAATPGPWAVPVANLFRVVAPEAPHTNPPQGITPPYPWAVVAEMGEDGTAIDANFIAHARTDVPRLVAEVERLRAENDDLARTLSTPKPPIW